MGKMGNAMATAKIPMVLGNGNEKPPKNPTKGSLYPI